VSWVLCSIRWEISSERFVWHIGCGCRNPVFWVIGWCFTGWLGHFWWGGHDIRLALIGFTLWGHWYFGLAVIFLQYIIWFYLGINDGVSRVGLSVCFDSFFRGIIKCALFFISIWWLCWVFICQRMLFMRDGCFVHIYIGLIVLCLLFSACRYFLTWIISYYFCHWLLCRVIPAPMYELCTSESAPCDSNVFLYLRCWFHPTYKEYVRGVCNWDGRGNRIVPLRLDWVMEGGRALRVARVEEARRKGGGRWSCLWMTKSS
jgi:hypothetical protein